jgi:very-short-patch-repair endonuclease
MAKRARVLRRSMTDPEVMLWSRLKGRGRDKPIFRRQVVFGTIILDFYCPAAKLAVEIDGSTHWEPEARERDEARDAWLERQGLDVLRIGAGWVYRDLDGVANAVILRAEERMGNR